MHQQLLKYEHFMDIVKLMRLRDIDSMSNSIVKKEYLLNAVLFNFRIVNSCRNWSQLPFLETFYIRTVAPKINNLLKVSCEHVLFKLFYSAFITALTIDSILSILTFKLLSFRKIFYM